ncbi:glycosyltransferase family 4 protein [Sphingomicrobium sediminis]|uniref:Glycosyltransferase n=1 Tax=Sphingomicrobium sediminis TaxID=2950949 RepID=A0A9X2EJS2_9SPHN|nr:glycosyltransferase [Sphingomicrobium sediminis]MCM8556634.1 glycosyltransferase [Sphingomicrobium sediminis]
MSRIILLQPSLASYRMDFFDRVARRFGERFNVFFSPGGLGLLSHNEGRDWANSVGPLKRLPGPIFWQSETSNIHIAAGDIVIVPGDARTLSTLLLAWRARRAGAKVVWWGQLWSATSKGWRQRLRLKLSNLADALLFYTDAEVAAYRYGIGKLDERPVSALNNGIDVEPIKKFAKPFESERRDRAILFVGRMTPKSGLPLLFEAMGDPRLCDVTLHLIGDGDLEDELRVQAKDKATEDRIVFHGATTDEAEIAQVASRCRLFVYPGQVGLSLIHAFAYGLPAVVHDRRERHMPEIAAFTPDETGFTFEENDATSLADAIASAIDHPNLDLMSRKAWAMAHDQFNSKMMAHRIIELIETLEKVA